MINEYKKNNNIIVKYPIEIEFTDFCSLKCKSCINPFLNNKWFIWFQNYIFFLDYLFNNIGSILYINISWIGDIFLHPEIETLLNIFIDKFKNTQINVLLPTKWQSIKINHINILKKFNDNWINLNISIGIYSIRKDIHDKLSWVNNFHKVLYFISILKKNNINFSIELLKNNYSLNEESEFNNFLKKINVNGSFHNYHNFSWSIISKNYIYWDETCTFNNYNYNLWFYCNFIPFLDCNWNVYSCSISWKNSKFLIWNIHDLFFKYNNYIDLVNYIKKDFLNIEKCWNCSIYKSNLNNYAKK